MTEERFSYTVKDTEDFLIKGAVLRSIEGVTFRSQARDGMELDPGADLKQIRALFEPYEVLASSYYHGNRKTYLRKDGHLIIVNLGPPDIDVELFSTGPDAAGPLAEIMAGLRPFRARNEEEDGVWAAFSHIGRRDNLMRHSQFLRCPRWKRVEENYPVAVRVRIEAVLALESPSRHGRLIIWHGPPGTGKTFAIRALMQEWKARFAFNVVTDPERLAADPSYYYQVAGESVEGPERLGPRWRRLWNREVIDPAELESNPKRCVFILEDTADLILQESRSNHFDKIGKLLNMTDGLFGQGREDIFLLTFNEDVDRIDPAFLRPGRCIANIEFTRFEAPEAAAWLARHGVEGTAPAAPMTLAEMYARVLAKEGTSAPAPQELAPPGFGIRRKNGRS